MNDGHFAKMVREELCSARAKHGPQGSAHEAYAVILEEVDEFWEEVRKKSGDRSKSAMLHELVQIAAMAQRAAEDLRLIGALAVSKDDLSELVIDINMALFYLKSVSIMSLEAAGQHSAIHCIQAAIARLEDIEFPSYDGKPNA